MSATRIPEGSCGENSKGTQAELAFGLFRTLRSRLGIQRLRLPGRFQLHTREPEILKAPLSPSWPACLFSLLEGVASCSVTCSGGFPYGR